MSLSKHHVIHDMQNAMSFISKEVVSHSSALYDQGYDQGRQEALKHVNQRLIKVIKANLANPNLSDQRFRQKTNGLLDNWQQLI